MKVEPARLANGIVNYADAEVIGNLPTHGKWLVGAGMGILTSRINNMVNDLSGNALIKAAGIIDESGMIDVDLLMNNLKSSASRYGKMTIQIPIVGALTFDESDVDSLRGYIERG